MLTPTTYHAFISRRMVLKDGKEVFYNRRYVREEERKPGTPFKLEWYVKEWKEPKDLCHAAMILDHLTEEKLLAWLNDNEAEHAE